MVAKGENGETSKWTVAIDEVLRVNWTAGESSKRCARIILEQFNVAFTKGAILGRADRKGYKAPAKRRQDYPKNRKKPATVRRIRSAGWRPYIALASALPPTRHVDGAGLTLLDLGPHDCRYPISPDDATSHLFCGRSQAPGVPYCLHHAQLCYRATPRMGNKGLGVPSGSPLLQTRKDFPFANAERVAVTEAQVPPPSTELPHGKSRSEHSGSSA